MQDTNKDPGKYDRTKTINYIIRTHNYVSYLEIGVRDANDNFNHIVATKKCGIDPNVDCKYRMTSDDYFATYDDKYDIIFIDGLHLEDQVWKDVHNSMNHVNPGWTIVMHDCNPIKKEHQVDKYNGGLWNGTVWKAFVRLRAARSDLYMCVMDVDHGIGIITPGEQCIIAIPKSLEYEWLEQHRKAILNLMTVDEFKSLYGQKRAGDVHDTDIQTIVIRT